MPLVHIVLFEFKPSVERSVIQDVRKCLFCDECGANRGVLKQLLLRCILTYALSEGFIY
jgi:hypothetical protein